MQEQSIFYLKICFQRNLLEAYVQLAYNKIIHSLKNKHNFKQTLVIILISFKEEQQCFQRYNNHFIRDKLDQTLFYKLNRYYNKKQQFLLKGRSKQGSMSSSHSLSKKATEYHLKIRRQKLEKLFKEKRSRLQINEEINTHFVEATNFIDSQHSTDELYELWNLVKIQTQKQKLQNFNQNYQPLKTSLKKICNIVSLAIKQINDYNQFLKCKIQPVLNQLNASSNQNNRLNHNNSLNQNTISNNLSSKLQVLWQIFQNLSNALINFQNKLLKLTEKRNSTEIKSRQYSYHLQISSILIEITYLKAPKVSHFHQSPLTTQYKGKQIYENILKFTQNIKKLSFEKLYSTCGQLVIILMPNFNVGIGCDQKQQLIQNLFYIIGNIISDYQPNSRGQNILNCLDNFSIDSKQFYKHLSNLEILRVLELQGCFNLETSQSYSSVTIHQSAIKSRDYLHCVQIQIWFSRLFIVGGWTNQIQNHYQHVRHQIEINILQKLKQLITIICVESILDTTSLIKKLQITSKKYVKKTIQLFSQLLLVCNLSLCEQISLYKQKKPNKEIQEINQIQNRYKNQTNYKIDYQKKDMFSIILSLRQFVQFFIKNHHAQQKIDLNLIDQLYIQLINICQKQIQTIQFIDQISPFLKQFVLDCSKGSVLSSEILTLPIQIMKKFTNKDLIRKIDGEINQFILHTYSKFLSSLDIINPISVQNEQRMIEQDDDTPKKGVFSSEYIQNKYKSDGSQIISYFVENLSLKKQEQFKFNYLIMLQQSYKFFIKINVQLNFISLAYQNSFHKNGDNKDKLKMFNVDRNDQMCEKDIELGQANQYYQQIEFYHESFDQNFLQRKIFYEVICGKQFITEEFLSKFFVFMVDQLHNFDFNSKLHTQSLRFVDMIITQSRDQKLEIYIKHSIQINAYGLKQYLQNMIMSQSQEVNQLVMNIFEKLQIQ